MQQVPRAHQTGGAQVLVADAEPVFRAGALATLSEAGLRVAPLAGDHLVAEVVALQRAVAVASAASDAVPQEPDRGPRCLVLDARLGDEEFALGTVTALRSVAPDLAVVLVIGRVGRSGLVEVLEAGARALVHRRCTPEELIAAVRSAIDGANWVSGPLAGPVRAELLAETSGERADALTPRELDVLRGLARGRTNAAIGTSLGISEHTVRNHVHSVLHKLGVANRTDAVATAVRRGLVDLAG